jgi:hypothetical protein
VELTALPVSSVNLTVQLFANGSALGSPITPPASDTFGEIDGFFAAPGLAQIGNITSAIAVNLYAQNISGPGNGTTILVPQTGITGTSTKLVLVDG